MISGETGVDEKFVACVDDANVSNGGGRLMHHFLEDSTGKNVVLQQHFSWLGGQACSGKSIFGAFF